MAGDSAEAILISVCVVAGNYNISSNVFAEGSETSGARASFRQALLPGIDCSLALNPEELPDHLCFGTAFSLRFCLNFGTHLHQLMDTTVTVLSIIILSWKVVNAVSVIVGPKEGDTPDRQKYKQVCHMPNTL